jgi:two-component system cell cycle sensor histidine kinase/response regulator CckA
MSKYPDFPLPALAERLPLVTYTNRYLPRVETLWMSPQVERVTGHRLEDWARPGFFEAILHPDDRALVLEEARASRQERRPFSRDYRLLRPDGRVLWIHDESVPILDGDGPPEFVQGYFVDITERKALERELVQAQKSEALARFAAGIAHDFNNILTAIAGYAEVARRSLAEDAPAGRPLAAIGVAVERAAKLTRQLLAFSRRQELEPQPVDLAQVVAGLESMLRHVVGPEVELTLALEPTPLVLTDVDQLEQVLMNLVSNARDAGASRVSLGTHLTTIARGAQSKRLAVAPGRYVVVVVVDDGEGMDEETQARAFDPFFTTKDRSRGTGLGLSLAQGVVRQSGGAMEVTSTIGAGSTFRVLLPAVGIG